MFEEENLPKLSNYLSNFNLDYKVVKSFDGHTGTIGRNSGKKILITIILLLIKIIKSSFYYMLEKIFTHLLINQK